MVLVILAALLVAMLVALRLRVLPILVMRIWFGIVMLVVVCATAALTFVFDSLRYVGVSRKTTQLLCTYVCVVTFRIALYANPHIQIRIDQSQQKWSEVPMHSAMVCNHTSFWDAYVFVGSAPVCYIYNTKTLMKSSLRKLPIFGPVFDRVGHFPVYFKSSADGDFSVDKEKQAAVAERISKHLEDLGRIALFPEGAVNKTPRQLQTFRFGSFSTIFQHKLKLYYYISIGNDETWPANASIGGFPADIDVMLGSYEVDYEKDDPKDVACKLQQEMQLRITERFAARDMKYGCKKSA